MQPGENDKPLLTEQKALSINLDELRYGTIVEIGAGQEVARCFFSAGAAAGTIAKTMSAYDMSFSDEIYGRAGRYVSRERVEQMLDHEYGLLESRLSGDRGNGTTFFTYASTVTAKSYKGDNECHGYIGIRFQLSPLSSPHNVYLHVRMMDDTNAAQTEALGMLGVNIIYGVFRHASEPRRFIESLLDNLDPDRLEIDFIKFEGEQFKSVENRLMNLHLIRSWCTRSVLFDSCGVSQVPGEALRKKPIMVIRGSFKPPTHVHVDMFKAGHQEFLRRQNVESEKVVKLAEITMAEFGGISNVADADFLARVDLLTTLGYDVLISDYFRYFKLRSWLRAFTQEPIGITLSVLDFHTLFSRQYYQGLEGGILEGLGKLFPDNTHVYVYPTKIDGELVTLDNVSIESSQAYLLEYLRANNLMFDCPAIDESHLHISARRTVDKIAISREGWQSDVPDVIAQQIIEKGLFGYPG